MQSNAILTFICNIWTNYVDYADNKEACQFQFKIDGSIKRIEDNKSILITLVSFVSSHVVSLHGQIFDMEPFLSMLELNIASFSLINALFNSQLIKLTLSKLYKENRALHITKQKLVHHWRSSRIVPNSELTFAFPRGLVPEQFRMVN